jgi:osmoprotectant transport system ATP-binding protein
MKLEPVHGLDYLPRLEESMSLKDALSEMIGAGTDRCVVADSASGEVRGAISLDSIKGKLHGGGS